MKTILQTGNLNFPSLTWPKRKIYMNEVIESRKGDSNKQAELFLEYCDTNFLEPFIPTPTRGQNILDLVLCNNSSIINNYTTIVNRKFSDHFSVKIWLNVNYNKENKEKNTHTQPNSCNITTLKQTMRIS